MKIHLVAIALLVSTPGITNAQWNHPSPANLHRFEASHVDAGAAAAALTQPRPASALVLGGVGGAVAGGLTGGFIGYTIDQHVVRSPCLDMCGAGGAALGFYTGAATGLPLGVYLANGSRGSVVGPLLASSAVGAGLGLLAYRFERLEPVAFAIPLAQLSAAIWAERRKERRGSP